MTNASKTVGLPVVLAYALPTAGIGLMFFLVSLYLMIFATDVLLISPAATLKS